MMKVTLQLSEKINLVLQKVQHQRKTKNFYLMNSAVQVGFSFCFTLFKSLKFVMLQGYFYIKSMETGEVVKSPADGQIRLEMPRTCRWMDSGKYFKWSGDMLVNDLGLVLTLMKFDLTSGSQG